MNNVVALNDKSTKNKNTEYPDFYCIDKEESNILNKVRDGISLFDFLGLISDCLEDTIVSGFSKFSLTENNEEKTLFKRTVYLIKDKYDFIKNILNKYFYKDYVLLIEDKSLTIFGKIITSRGDDSIPLSVILQRKEGD